MALFLCFYYIFRSDIRRSFGICEKVRAHGNEWDWNFATEHVLVNNMNSAVRICPSVKTVISSAECYSVLSPFLGHIKCDTPLESESKVLSPGVVRCWNFFLDFMLLTVFLCSMSKWLKILVLNCSISSTNQNSWMLPHGHWNSTHWCVMRMEAGYVKCAFNSYPFMLYNLCCGTERYI